MIPLITALQQCMGYIDTGNLMNPHKMQMLLDWFVRKEISFIVWSEHQRTQDMENCQLPFRGQSKLRGLLFHL